MPEFVAGRDTGGVLAFDFGEKRIGVASGDLMLGMATPLTTITGETTDQRFGAIEALIREWQPVLLVVGLPTHMDGTPHAVTQMCLRFANRLSGRFRLPVRMVDERLSSAHSDSLLREINLGSKKRKAVLDQVAAQHILQHYFDFPALSLDVTNGGDPAMFSTRAEEGQR